jgi:hypothetical protein
MRQAWRHPLTTLVLATLLAGSVSLLPSTPWNRSIVGKVVEELAIQVFGKARRTHHVAFVSTCVEFVRGGEGIGDKWMPVDLEQSADVFLKQYQNAHQHVDVCLMSGTRRTGFWAPTTRTDEFRMSVSPLRSGTPVPAGNDRDQLRLAYAEYLATRPGLQNDAALLRQGEYVRHSIIWTGILHNIASLVLAALFFRSLAWVKDMPRWFRRTSRESLLRRNLCPTCRYSIEGLTAPTCPECGSVLPQMVDPAARDAKAARP